MSSRLNWDTVLADIKGAIQDGCDPSYRALSRYLNLPYTTLHDGLERAFGIRAEDLSDLAVTEGKTERGENYKKTETETSLVVDIKPGADIRDLDEMLLECKVDLDVWEVERWLVNKYPGMRRNEQKDLTFYDGKIVDGYVRDQGELTITQLFQVKVWLRRKVPLQPEIVIQPVEISVKVVPFEAGRDDREDSGVAVIVPDIQFGFIKDLNTGELITFHDREALDIAVQLIEYVQPDQVVILGDTLDLPDWSDKFLTSPEFYWCTQSSVIEAAWWLGQISVASPKAKRKLLAGNHERRFDTAIITHLKAAYNLRPADELDLPPSLSIERLLGLAKLDIEYLPVYPNEAAWINPYIQCVHGDIARKGSGVTTRALIADSDVTKIQGHIHKIELVMRTISTYGQQKTVYGFSPGCLCKIDGTVPGSKGRGWQQGIGIVYYNGMHHHLDAVPINSGKALFDGKKFVASDRTDAIRNDTNWEL